MKMRSKRLSERFDKSWTGLESAHNFKNTIELIRKLNLVCRYRENYSNLKDEVYRKVLNEYSWSKISENYLIFLNELNRENNQLINELDFIYDSKKA